MTTTVQKWGNSQGIRLSKEILATADINCGDKVDIYVADDVITIRKIKAKKIDLLFENYNGDYVPTELSWGEPIGGELW
ncbi:MAG: AbrB/MazE/SpoVT family DNA-binding domain-containing protein [Saccharofermentans sp.]|nr:AbrB/MazE/SpoVT family DNA-binding domain-containing protein [Saccharofermentans sp.]